MPAKPISDPMPVNVDQAIEITIDDYRLSVGEVMTLRMAINSWWEQSEKLGRRTEDAHGKAMYAGHARICERLMDRFFAVQDRLLAEQEKAKAE